MTTQRMPQQTDGSAVFDKSRDFGKDYPAARDNAEARWIVSPASLRTMWVPIGKRGISHDRSLNHYGLCFGVGDVDG